METAPAPDPNDWRTWRRDGVRIFPPADATHAQAMEGWTAFCAARWGINPDRPRKDRRNVIRVLKKIDGRYEQVRYCRATERGVVDIRVRGGCRI
jgi:hypothetical protein